MSNEFRKSVLTGGNPAAKGGNPLIQAKQGQGASGDNLSSVNIGRSETRAADHRDGDRHRLTGEQIAAHWRGTGYDVELVNLSGGGAMIAATDFSPNMWDRVDLLLGEGAPIESAVRWLRNGRIGLEFAHETRIEGNPEVRDQTLLSVIRRTFPNVIATPAEHRPEPAAAPVVHDNARRIERRHPLIWLGQVHFNHDTTPVRLRNISESGALVESASPLTEGVEVMLDLSCGVTQFARVSWVRSNQAGLAFTEPFDVSRLADARPEVTPNEWVRPGFLDTKDDSTPWDPNWDRPTVEQLRGDLEGYLKY